MNIHRLLAARFWAIMCIIREFRVVEFEKMINGNYYLTSPQLTLHITATKIILIRRIISKIKINHNKSLISYLKILCLIKLSNKLKKLFFK